MKLQFDPNQDYQLAAIAAVVEVFKGQPDASQSSVSWKDALSSLELTETGVANRRVIDDASLLQNLNAVQQQHGIAPSTALAHMCLDNGTPVGDFPNFTVEMETGTGKTYVYLRTVYELARVYGFKKFVIVVPSVAIREGVLASLRQTREHLQVLYGHPPVTVTAYRSARVSALRNFALSNEIQILVITIDAFAKDILETHDTKSRGTAKSRGNIINQVRETGVKPIEFIQNSRPIVILDEPQNLETDLRKTAIARLNPLCTLRYSATHRNSYNLVYSLDPVRAYELGLVKRIGVDSVLQLDHANQAFVQLAGFKSGKRSLAATLTIWANQKHGVDKKTVTVKVGDDLYAEKFSNRRELYRDRFIVNEIDARDGVIVFANDVRVRMGQPHGALIDAILRLQIEATVRRHFEKARKLHPRGVKVLSVFFIDRVDHYRSYTEDGRSSNGKFAQWFEQAYIKMQQQAEFAGVLEFAASAVHNGYFSRDKQSISPFETRSGKTNAEAESSAFELIMRDKERLLSLDEPLAFIFSHSALREGWDNPNVFQICTLAESSSALKKRQEIGRGLRLAVDQAGARVRDAGVNHLTVIANESYDEFARQLQSEMQDAGVRFKSEMLHNERDKISVRLKKGYATDPAFLALWQAIRARTRYRVQYQTKTLVATAASRIRDTLPALPRPQLALARAALALSTTGVAATQTGLRTHTVDLQYVMPDFLTQLQQRTGLSTASLAEILLQSQRLADALHNPQQFIDECAHIINAVKRAFLVHGDGSADSGVHYAKCGGAVYEMRRFERDDWMEVFASGVHIVGKPEKTLFSHIVIDANSGPERAFAQACEDNDDVLFYIKLPRWFVIDTPVGAYTPDWALAWRNDATLYFVAETKDTGGRKVQLDLMRPLEQLKIECGKRHFKPFEQVQFRVVKQLDELVN